MAKQSKADEVLDLTEIAPEDEGLGTEALANLKRNMSHLLISSLEDEGPEIDFGEAGQLKFKPRIPATAMLDLLGNENHVEGLRNYIRRCLLPESRQVFEELLDDLELASLNAIVEFLSEATTSFPTK